MPKQPDEKRPVGRPSEYRPEYCDTVLELGRMGYSKTQIAVKLEVTRGTLDNWAEEKPEFLTALTQALECSEAHWERIQETMASDPEHRGNKTLEHLMRSRFRGTYGDKTEIAHSGHIDGFAIEFVNERHPAADEGEG